MKPKFTLEENEHFNSLGYPVCDICGKNRFFINPDDTNVVVRVMCKCQKEKYEEEERQKKLELEKNKIELAKTQSFLGKRYANASFDTAEITDENKKAYQIVKSYAEKNREMLDKGYGFYVYGDNGCGKTHLIACLCNYLTENGQRCIFTNFTNIANDIRKSYNTEYPTDCVVDKYSNIPFLFLDDFGKEGYKKANGEIGWIDEQLFTILNNRYNNMLPTIFSSNFSLADLGDVLNYDRALIDRATEMSTRIIHLQGKNRRLPDKDDWE